MEAPEWAIEVASRQLGIVAQTWAALAANDIPESTPLRLDFTYSAPDEAAAEKLVALLRVETDYEVDTDFKREADGNLTWSVVGSTPWSTLTQPVHEDWVRWMVAAGAQYGSCVFDGFTGALPPGA